MTRTYGYYYSVVHALDGERNRLAQTLQISGSPKRVEEFLHTLGAREEKHSQLATPVSKQRSKHMPKHPYFISLNDETGQIFSAVGENMVSIVSHVFPNQFLSSFSML